MSVRKIIDIVRWDLTTDDDVITFKRESLMDTSEDRPPVQPGDYKAVPIVIADDPAVAPLPPPGFGIPLSIPTFGDLPPPPLYVPATPDYDLHQNTEYLSVTFPETPNFDEDDDDEMFIEVDQPDPILIETARTLGTSFRTYQ